MHENSASKNIIQFSVATFNNSEYEFSNFFKNFLTFNENSFFNVSLKTHAIIRSSMKSNIIVKNMNTKRLSFKHFFINVNEFKNTKNHNTENENKKTVFQD